MTTRFAGSSGRRRVLIGFTLMVAIAGLTWSAAAVASSAENQDKATVLVDDWWRDAGVVTPAQPVRILVDDWWRDAGGRTAAKTAPLLIDDWWRDAAPRVVAPQVGDDRFDWTDALIGAAVALALAGIAGFGIWWITLHHGSRHPRGPAVPAG